MADTPKVTSENLNTLVYVADVGTQYQLTKDCMRTMGVPFIEIDDKVSALMQKANATSTNKGADNHAPKVYREIVALVTHGDELPKKGYDMRVLTRIVADFFTFRMPKAGPQMRL